MSATGATSRPLIVCYHAISADWRSGLATPPAAVRSQLALLKRRGYVSLTFTEAEQMRANGGLPQRAVVITFDDGFASVLRAKAIMDELELVGTVFVVTRFVESSQSLNWPGMRRTVPHNGGELQPLEWHHLAELADAGWEIGSHTHSHALLPGLADEELFRELDASRHSIRTHLGRCDAISYPYGLADERVAAAARRAGYSVGCTLSRVHLVDEPLRRARLELTGADRGFRLRAKLSPIATRLRHARAAAELAKMRRRVHPPDWLPPTSS
jgi:peptidoglycan/xylan/chitin deacetylase (PgdA/CDA1 family)